jgi:repressor LexA
MRGLTEKQREILDFIEDFSEMEGMAPTVYEIADQFDIKTSTVSAHLQALQKKDFLSRTNKARSLSINRRTPRKVRHMSFALPIPLLGRINAGALVDNLEYKEGEVF